MSRTFYQKELIVVWVNAIPPSKSLNISKRDDIRSKIYSVESLIEGRWEIFQ